jgi:hypothetical protein
MVFPYFDQETRLFPNRCTLLLRLKGELRPEILSHRPLLFALFLGSNPNILGLFPEDRKSWIEFRHITEVQMSTLNTAFEVQDMMSGKVLEGLARCISVERSFQRARIVGGNVEGSPVVLDTFVNKFRKAECERQVI